MANIPEDENGTSSSVLVKVKCFVFDEQKYTWLYTVKIDNSSLDGALIVSLPEKSLVAPMYQLGDQVCMMAFEQDCYGVVDYV